MGHGGEDNSQPTVCFITNISVQIKIKWPIAYFLEVYGSSIYPSNCTVTMRGQRDPVRGDSDGVFMSHQEMQL